MQSKAMRLKRKSLVVLIACLAVSLFCLVYPIYVIRPFRHQGVRELAAALAVLQARLVVTLICSALAVWSAMWIWGTEPKRWLRFLAVVAAVAVSAFTALARINIYELMFHPVEQFVFVSAAQVKLEPGEMVVAVNLNGTARAYPIRSMSYHHVVNDVVAGRPITATY
jgi:hypothetical protein